MLMGKYGVIGANARMTPRTRVIRAVSSGEIVGRKENEICGND